MTRRAAFLLAIVLIVMAGDGFPPALGPAGSDAQTQVPRVAPGFFDPAQRAGSAYKNVDPEYRRASYWARLHSLVIGATWLVSENRVAALPLGTPDLGALREGSRGATVTWIGHSTVLVQLDGVTFLTDPTWAERSGPFSGFIGVRRYTPPGIAFDDLPPIDFVLISHDHYDHLDEPTV
ncbi:MAG TPA: MBL fold metallo-hydrolase, partial [Candidatus Binatia bacterium]|nr:MBL fold metallo-hydrolase [Candidatus Binatia bacterium]